MRLTTDSGSSQYLTSTNWFAMRPTLPNHHRKHSAMTTWRRVLVADPLPWLLEEEDPPCVIWRWRNASASNGKTWVEIERQGQLSKWVTLRACRVLTAVYA